MHEVAIVRVVRGPFVNGPLADDDGRCPVCKLVSMPPPNKYDRIQSCPKCHWVSELMLVPNVPRGQHA